MDEVKMNKVENLPVLDEVPEGATLIAEVDGEFYRVKGEGVGGGLPEGGEPNQQLVTDADGAVKWEDKPFYETRKFESKSVYMEETVLSPVESPTIPVVGFEDRTYERSGLAHTEDANYAVIWNGVHYPFAGRDYKLVLGDGSSAMFFYGNLHILNDAKVAMDGTEYPMFEELTFEDTGEPFAMMKFAPRNAPLVLFSAADTIEGVVCEIVEGDFVETVKTLDPKFVPELVVNFTLNDSVCSADKTFDEVAAAIVAGKSVRGVFRDNSGVLSLAHMPCQLSGCDSDNPSAMIFNGTLWNTEANFVEVVTVSMLDNGNMMWGHNRYALTVAE